jgi:hypothetical protein
MSRPRVARPNRVGLASNNANASGVTRVPAHAHVFAQHPVFVAPTSLVNGTCGVPRTHLYEGQRLFGDTGRRLLFDASLTELLSVCSLARRCRQQSTAGAGVIFGRNTLGRPFLLLCMPMRPWAKQFNRSFRSTTTAGAWGIISVRVYHGTGLGPAQIHSYTVRLERNGKRQRRGVPGVYFGTASQAVIICFYEQIHARGNAREITCISERIGKHTHERVPRQVN